MRSPQLASLTETTRFAGHKFWRVGDIQIRRTANGDIEEYVHDLPPGTRRNRYASGPFCRLGVPAAPRASGVYAVLVDSHVRYVGQCQDLAQRFGPRGYGEIHPRNCHHDGQTTNCKVNARILEAAKGGLSAVVWFHPTENPGAFEAELIRSLAPSWNGTVAPSGGASGGHLRQRRPLGRRSRPRGSSPGKADFESALRGILSDARARGEATLELKAGDLHEAVGGYPGPDHRMPSCCSAMRSLMRATDCIVSQPPKGDGASLTIRYQLGTKANLRRVTF